jgi:hypothetical protein
VSDFIPSGHHGSSAVENREHEPGLFARRVVNIPSNQKIRIAYNGSGQEEYVGFAPKGLNENETGWMIYKLTYSSNRLEELNIASNAVWDNRTTETYS